MECSKRDYGSFQDLYLFSEKSGSIPPHCMHTICLFLPGMITNLLSSTFVTWSWNIILRIHMEMNFSYKMHMRRWNPASWSMRGSSLRRIDCDWLGSYRHRWCRTKSCHVYAGFPEVRFKETCFVLSLYFAVFVLRG